MLRSSLHLVGFIWKRKKDVDCQVGCGASCCWTVVQGEETGGPATLHGCVVAVLWLFGEFCWCCRIKCGCLLVLRCYVSQCCECWAAGDFFFFAFVGGVAKCRKAAVSFVMSQHGATGPQLGGLSWNFLYEYFWKICRGGGIQVWLKSDKNDGCVYIYIYVFIYVYSYIIMGDRGGTVVKVLSYKSEGRWFDSRWCHWNFSLT